MSIHFKLFHIKQSNMQTLTLITFSLLKVLMSDIVIALEGKT